MEPQLSHQEMWLSTLCGSILLDMVYQLTLSMAPAWLLLVRQSTSVGDKEPQLVTRDVAPFSWHWSISLLFHQSTSVEDIEPQLSDWEMWLQPDPASSSVNICKGHRATIKWLRDVAPAWLLLVHQCTSVGDIEPQLSDREMWLRPGSC